MEKVTERLWEEYRDKHIKPDCEPEYIKTVAVIFYAGMFSMFRELMEVNKETAKVLSDEFTEAIKEFNNAAEDKRRDGPSQLSEI